MSLSKFVELDRDAFVQHYYAYVYIRIMQALGAYGFRGFYERKSHFLQSVPFALNNLRWLLHNVKLPIELPTLMEAFTSMVGSEKLRSVSAQAETLAVRIFSFSFHQGLPKDESGNGGGFVFDARSIPNPGREEQYKNLTGKDAPVMDYLNQQESVHQFLASVMSLVDASLAEYQRRGFKNLMVSFGCTGGQHRSVYLCRATGEASARKERPGSDSAASGSGKDGPGESGPMKAMVLAAGLGTRLRPLTDDRPKALVEVNGRTMLEITLARLRSFGVSDVIINVHHFADLVLQYLKANNDFGMRIAISQETVLLDTGGGLKQAAYFFAESASGSSEPFILHNVDVISNIDLDRMIRSHSENRALATLAVQERETSRHLLFDSQLQLCGRKTGRDQPELVRSASETQALAFSGIHIISPRLLGMMTEEGVFSIITTYLRLAGQGEKILGFRADEYYWRDLGKPENVRQAAQDLRDKVLLQ